MTNTTVEYAFRRVRRRANASAPLPADCFRFTGSGDRPCAAASTPMSYALTPWNWASTSKIAIVSHWSWSKTDAFNPYIYMDATPMPYDFADGALVEVIRYAERTSYVGGDGNGYGAWYWVAPGSGVAVNIGKAIRFEYKHDAIEWSVGVAFGERVACEEAGDKCTEHDDILFCAAARSQGYDSILTRRMPEKLVHVSGRVSDMVELIVCPIEMLPAQHSACVDDVTMSRFESAGFDACTCNPEAEVATCTESGDLGRVSMTSDYGTTHALTIIGLAVGIYLIVPLLLLGVCWWRRRGRREGRRDGNGRNGGDGASGGVGGGDRPLLSLR